MEDHCLQRIRRPMRLGWGFDPGCTDQHLVDRPEVLLDGQLGKLHPHRRSPFSRKDLVCEEEEESHRLVGTRDRLDQMLSDFGGAGFVGEGLEDLEEVSVNGEVPVQRPLRSRLLRRRVLLDRLRLSHLDDREFQSGNWFGYD